jgi:hypothetical protein
MIAIGIIVLVIILWVALSIGRATEQGVNRFLGEDEDE